MSLSAFLASSPYSCLLVLPLVLALAYYVLFKSILTSTDPFRPASSQELAPGCRQALLAATLQCPSPRQQSQGLVI